jgi:starch phosphorylase
MHFGGFWLAALGMKMTGCRCTFMTKLSRKNSSAKKPPVRKSVKASKSKPVQDFAVAPKTNDAVASFRADILRHLTFTLARDTTTAIRMDWWLATCFTLRDRVLERFLHTQGAHATANSRRVYYLSLEYLMGRLLRNNLCNLGQLEIAREALTSLGKELDDVIEEENDMGLGNGGLGRLAACFLDSLATMDIPAVGYGIHYEFGLFRQTFVNGRQVEEADNWLARGTPWKIRRPEYQVRVPLYGSIEMGIDDRGNFSPQLVGTQDLIGIPWDIPIVGLHGSTVNFLRLWESKATTEFDFRAFDQGDYVEAVRSRISGETVSKVLYPNDSKEAGKELRLVQQIFFVSCSLQDILRRHRRRNDGWANLADKVVIQLNDTHPSIAVAELMRLLVDRERLPWDDAWALTTRIFNYTNHTLLPEALEIWSVELLGRVLPRHLQIIYEINQRFLEEVEARWPGDDARKAELSLIGEGPVRHVRMAHLAIVGSTKVNGVAELHTRLLKAHLLKGFDELTPGKIVNMTNGITPRRWLRACNPGLSSLCDEVVGPTWESDLSKLRALETVANDRSFQDRFLAVKRDNKVRLAKVIQDTCQIVVNPDSLFDVQIKRLHEYKRQHLNLLHILTLYRRMLNDPKLDITPRTFIFGAKAAPGYTMAKHIIHAINRVAAAVNHDVRVRGKIKVVFLPDYRVSLAEQIIPAADLSEQISTAGKEASGTGNMKLALNGALTIGTLDGANVEILEEVGKDNIFIFGLNVDEVAVLRSNGYDPAAVATADEELKAVLDWLVSDYFTPEQPGALAPLVDGLLLGGDPYLVLADYRAYITAQDKAAAVFRDRRAWAKMAIMNTARMGKFSSDRTIGEYAKEIWKIKPVRG